MKIEDKIQEVIKPIINSYSKIENDIIEKIAEHFNKNEEFINADHWYFKKLEELGGLNNETLRILEKYTNKNREQLLDAMNQIGITSISTEQLNIAGKQGILDPNKIIESQSIQNIINLGFNDTRKEFLQINKNIKESVRKTYQNILTDTYIKVNSGIYSYQEAILSSLNELGDKGISILQYKDKNGNIKNYDVVGTVRRDLLIATRGLAGKVNEQVIKESGNHIIRVSRHFGARIGDGQLDFTNHAWWQELQFFCWDYDDNATKEEKKLPDFIKTCNYGHVQGILGINCKHYFTIWYGSLEKDKVDYNYDENLEQYEKIKKQRYLEENVRKWKRKQVIAKQIEDKGAYKKSTIKAKEWQDKLINFTKENDLKRDFTREYVKDYKPVTIKEESGIISNIDKYTQENFNLGIKTKKEHLLLLNSITGQLENPILKGTGSEVMFSDELIEKIIKSPKDSYILMHNHPNNSSFSAADLNIINKFDSIKELKIIGHDKTKYSIIIDNGERLSISKLKEDYDYFKRLHRKEFFEKFHNGELTQEEAWKQHSHKLVTDLANKYKWKYKKEE